MLALAYDEIYFFLGLLISRTALRNGVMCKKVLHSYITCGSPVMLNSHPQAFTRLTFGVMELLRVLICNMAAPTARDGKKVLRVLQFSTVLNHYSLWIFPPQSHEISLFFTVVKIKQQMTE